MDLQILLLLGQDGITNGAIYALLALALVLVFTVTRVIFIPQGEFVAFGALTLAALQAGHTPGVLLMLIALGALAQIIEVISRTGQDRTKRYVLIGVAALLFVVPTMLALSSLAGIFLFLLTGPALIVFSLVLSALAITIITVLSDRTHLRALTQYAIFTIAYPSSLWVALLLFPPLQFSLFAQAIIALAVVVPIGPLIYRVAYQPLASASVLVLLIVSVAVHLALIGLGLLFFGAEGSRTPAFTDLSFELAGAPLQGQTILVVFASAVLIIGLYFFFERTLYGKALRATAMNRTGARLMGIPPILAGKLCFTLAAAIGALSGILIAPITTIYYDSGFLIGLKGFVGAIIGGLASYPLAALGAVLVGLLEAYSSFYASAFKEVIVFTLIIPVLIWRSMTAKHVEEEEE